MTIKYYIGEILERNGGFEYKTKYVFQTDKAPDEYTDGVAMRWRGGDKHDWDVNEGGYRSDHTLIFDYGSEELTKEEFDVLSGYLSIMEEE